MIPYLLRTLPLVLRAAVHARGQRVSRLRRRVHLREIDVNLHMNQAVYAQVMELGRLDWVVRTGAWRRWRAAGVNPVMAEQRLVYRRELRPLQAYDVDTRAVAVRGRLLWFEQHLLVGDRVHARESATIFIGPDGVLSPEALLGLASDLPTDALVLEDWRVRG